MIPGTGPDKLREQLGQGPAETDDRTQQVDQIASAVIRQDPGATPIDPKRVSKEKPFISAYRLEDKGDHFVFCQRLDDKEILHLNLEQFPVGQRNFASLKGLIEEKGPEAVSFLESLGIRIDTDSKTLYFPKTEVLRARLDEYSKINPLFPQLSLIEVSEILPPEDFLNLMLTKDIIISQPPDIIHDICFHVIPKIIRVFMFSEGYKPYKEQITSTFTELQDGFQRANENFQEFISSANQILEQDGKPIITKEEWDLMQGLLKFSMSACLDVESSNDESFEQGKELKKLLFKTQKYVINDLDPKGWEPVWRKELNLTAPTCLQVGKITTTQSRTKHFLFALYAQPFFKEVEGLKAALKTQLTLAKQDSTPFLVSLNQKLKKNNKDAISQDVWIQIQAHFVEAMGGAFNQLSIEFFKSLDFISDKEILEKALPYIYEKLPHSPDLDFDLFKEIILIILQKQP